MEGSRLKKEGESLRLFLGLPLAYAFQEELQTFLNPIASKLKSVYWVRSESFHVTLHFFGQTSSEKLPEICSIIKPICKKNVALRINLTKVGYFPAPKNPKVLWLGLGGDIKGLKQLQFKVTQALDEKGYFIENRPYRPHATLGRISRPLRYLKESSNLKLKFFPTEMKTIDFIALFRSRLYPDGARYEIYERYPLAT